MRLRVVSSEGREPERAVLDRLSEALAGGDPIAPLPPDPREAARVLDALQPDRPVTEPDAALVVATSGSTGRPKGVVLAREALTASARATHERLGGPGDWLLALPVHYVAGLMVLARAMLAGTRVVPIGADLSGLTTSGPPASSGRGTSGAGPATRRYLSIVPTQLVRALADAELTRQLAGLDAVLLGGAAVAPDLLDRARAAGVPVVTTYGMSETCGGCVYDGVPLDGVGVGLDGHDRISLSGECVFSGYRLAPRLSAEALATDHAGRRTLRTQDRGSWSDGRLQVLGRIDDVVVSGGLNVDLAAVERAARTAPGLDGAEVGVVALPDDEWGVRVVAVTDQPALTETDLRRHLEPSLPAHALPRALVVLPALPRTSSGKLDRQALIRDLSAREANL